MGKIIKLEDWRTSKYDRAVKKQTRDRLMNSINNFLENAGVFLDKVNSKKGQQMVEDMKDETR